MPEIDEETQAAQEAQDEQDYQAAIEEQPVVPVDEDEDVEDDINPWEVAVTDLDVSFQTNISDTDGDLTLAEGANIAALNVIRNGLDAYTILYTDRPTGRQWLSQGGYFVALTTPEPDKNDTEHWGEDADGATDG